MFYGIVRGCVAAWLFLNVAVFYGKEKVLPEYVLKNSEVFQRWFEHQHEISELSFLGFSAIYRSNLKAFSTLIEALPIEGVKKLTFSVYFMSQAELKALMRALINTEVVSLDLSVCGLCSADMEIIAEFLPLTNIKDLNLSSNYKIGSSGVSILSEVLPRTKLENLKLMNCKISNKGLEKLAQHLPQSHLKGLWVSNNCIQDNGALALAVAIPNSHLELIDLSSNAIGNRGVKAVCEVISQSNVKNINISSNLTTLDIRVYFAELKKNYPVFSIN